MILGVFLVSSWIAAQAGTAKARKIGDDWLFPPVIAVKAIFLVAAAMGLGLAILCVHASRREPQALWGVFGCSLWVALCIGGYPKSVWLSEIGLSQRNWFGGWKVLKWEAVAHVAQRTWDGSDSVVISGKGATIVFSSAHSGRELFLEELGRRNLMIGK